MNTGQAPKVKETILKRKRLSDRQTAERAAERLIRGQRKTGRGKDGKKNAEEFVKKAEKFVLEYRNEERFSKRAKRGLRSKKKLPLPSKRGGAEADCKVVLAVRIRGNESIPEEVARALRKWRLNAVCDAVILERNAYNLRTLRMVESFVTYGYPTLKTTKELVHKRGFARIRAENSWTNRPLSDNRMIEEQLGKHGLICTEDLIDELWNTGEHFYRVVSFLQPFKLRAPSEGFAKQNKLQPFKQPGGVYGDRGDAINELTLLMI